jgi:hypothetical protein
MYEPVKIRLKQVWTERRFSLAERLNMTLSLVLCLWYDWRATRAKYELLRRGYDSMYLAHWILHKRIYYKPRKEHDK